MPTTAATAAAAAAALLSTGAMGGGIGGGWGDAEGAGGGGGGGGHGGVGASGGGGGVGGGGAGSSHEDAMRASWGGGPAMSAWGAPAAGAARPGAPGSFGYPVNLPTPISGTADFASGGAGMGGASVGAFRAIPGGFPSLPTLIPPATTPTSHAGPMGGAAAVYSAAGASSGAPAVGAAAATVSSRPAWGRGGVAASGGRGGMWAGGGAAVSESNPYGIVPSPTIVSMVVSERQLWEDLDFWQVFPALPDLPADIAADFEVRRGGGEGGGNLCCTVAPASRSCAHHPLAPPLPPDCVTMPTQASVERLVEAVKTARPDMLPRLKAGYLSVIR